MIDRMLDKATLAAAMGRTLHQFEAVQPALDGLGFPAAAGEEGRWHVSDLLDWITGQQEDNLRFVEALSGLISRAAD